MEIKIHTEEHNQYVESYLVFSQPFYNKNVVRLEDNHGKIYDLNVEELKKVLTVLL